MPSDPHSAPAGLHALAPGTRVQDHVIVAWLRSLADGHLYRVVDAATGTPATLHEYLPGAWATRDGGQVLALPSRGPEFRAGLHRFLLRAQQLKQLDHPALPVLADLWSCDGTAYALMPPLVGQSLAEVVQAQGGSLPLTMVMPWLRTCCDVAEHLHAQGKLHGAWDPQAVWVLQNGKLLLPPPEIEGGVQTPSPWSALEQTVLAPGRAQRGGWTDVYGIAALAGFMLTGQNPIALMRQMGAYRWAPGTISGEDENQPGALMAAIRVGLMANPRERPQQVSQLRAMMGIAPMVPLRRHRQLMAGRPTPAAAPGGEALRRRSPGAGPAPGAKPSGQGGFPRGFSPTLPPPETALPPASVRPAGPGPVTPPGPPPPSDGPGREPADQTPLPELPPHLRASIEGTGPNWPLQLAPQARYGQAAQDGPGDTVPATLPGELDEAAEPPEPLAIGGPAKVPPAARAHARRGTLQIALAMAAAALLAVALFILEPPSATQLAGPAPTPTERVAELERVIRGAPPSAGPPTAAAPAAPVPAPAAANGSAGQGAVALQGPPAALAAGAAIAGAPEPAAAAPVPASPERGLAEAAAKPATGASAAALPSPPGPAAAGAAAVAGVSGAESADAAPRLAARARLPRCSQALLEQSLGQSGAQNQISRECR